MYSAGLSQKVAAQFRETGRHGLGSHIHGVAACVECRGTTLRAQKSFFIEKAPHLLECIVMLIFFYWRIANRPHVDEFNVQ